MVFGATSGASSTVTVVFTDLVASTETRVGLGEEAAERLRRTHDRLVSRAVETHHGRVVKGLGDGLMAVFPAASDALAAAVAAQQALARHNRSAPQAARMDVRMGLSAGDVAIEDGDCFGTCVVEAARLCEAAGGGQVLATDVVRALAGTRGGHRFGPSVPRELKGLPGSVGVVEVTWEPRTGAVVPLPAALDQHGSLPFLGRERELQLLTRAWAEAATGYRAVILAGEPGIGKTRLVAELAERVHAQGAPVLYGRCHEDLDLPYQPFAEALHTYVSDCPLDELTDQLGPLGGELVRIVPGLPKHVPHLSAPLPAEPETERYRLFEAVADLLAAAGTPAPSLLILEDLHWTDRPTLALLRHLVRPGYATCLLVVLTYRDVEIDPAHPLAELQAALRKEPGVEQMSLGGLTVDHVGQLVRGASGDVGAFTVPLAEAVYTETDGNPFFVGEVVRHLGESVVALLRTGREAADELVAELGIPEGVRELVARRLSRLPEAVRHTLSVAAVVGQDFDAGLLMAASRFDRDVVLDALGQAEQARVVTPVGSLAERYRFTHALMRSAVYENLSAGRRAQIHFHVAEAIERSGDEDEAAELAYHLHAAGPAGDPARAVEVAVRAGEQASARLAHEEAAAHYGLALQALRWLGREGTGRRGAILLARAEACRRAGDRERTRDDLRAAIECFGRAGDAEGLARAAVGLGEVADVWGTDTELIQLLETALERLGLTHPGLQARLLARLGQALFYGDRQRCLQLSAEAVEQARRAADPATLAAVLCARHVALSGPDHLNERTVVADEVIRLATEAGEPELAQRGYAWRIVDRLEAGDVEGVDRDIAVHADRAAELRQPLHLRDVAAWRSMRALLDGRFDDAERAAREARALGERAGDEYALMIERLQLGWLAYDRGGTDELSAWMPPWSDDAERFRTNPGWYAWEAGVALLELELGNEETARTRYETMAADVVELPRDAVWLLITTLAADLCTRLGDVKQADPLYQALAPYAGHVVVIDRGWVCRGAVDRLLAQLAGTMGDGELAAGHARAALAVHEHVGARPFLARTRCAYAHILLEHGAPAHRAEAMALAQEGLGLARSLGMAALTRQAERLVDACRR